MTPGRKTSLVRGLGPWAAGAVTVGTMIGTGIYLKPSEMARLAGTPDLVILAWVVAGFLSLLGALCYAELGTAMPEAGGPYIFLRRAFGPRWGFLYGWATAWVTSPASTASLAAGTLLFASYFFPGLSTVLVSLEVPVPGGPWLWSITLGQVLAAGLIGLIVLINFMRVAAVGWVGLLLTGIKVLSLAVVIGLGVVLGIRETGPALSPVAVHQSGGLSGFLAAVVAALWAYTGWHTLLHAGGEVADPARNIPRAVIGGFLGTATLFIIFNLVCLAVLPFEQIARSEHVASDMLLAVAGPGLAGWLTLAMIISAIGTLNSSTMAGARVPFAMAREGEFFEVLGRVDSRTAVPQAAVAFQGLLAPLLVLTGTFEELTALFVFAQWSFFGLSGAALIRLRSADPDRPGVYRSRPYPLVPLLFVILAGALAVSILIQRPVRSGLGLLLILTGLPAWSLWTRGRKSVASSQQPPRQIRRAG